MGHVHGFPAIARPTARVLILGTAPGKASLLANQYYAHSRNSFWKILGEVLGFSPSLPYNDRVEVLHSRGIAVWDVLQLCTRETSLDSDIDDSSIVPNSFASFYRAHPAVQRVCFNGAKADELYRRHVVPALSDQAASLDLVTLPSTSPANAAVPYPDKLQAWAKALTPVLTQSPA